MPTLNINVSEAMRLAVKQFAKAQTQLRGERVSVSDVVCQALRNAGFEREDVLEALARGDCPDIDVRTRTAAAKRPLIERISDYIATRGCQTEADLQRNLHLHADTVRRVVIELLRGGELMLRPFDRPTILHWHATCKCPTALPNDPVKAE